MEVDAAIEDERAVNLISTQDDTPVNLVQPTIAPAPGLLVLAPGSGAGASSGSRVSLQWVLRRSNGYFVTSSFGQVASGPDAGILKLSGTSVNDPFLFTVGSCVEIKFTARSR